MTYTQTQAEELRLRYPNKRIYAAPNALYHASSMQYEPDVVRNSVLYVGRLHAAKKPALALTAFEKAADNAAQIQFDVVGDGDETDHIRRLRSSSRHRNRIHLHGHVSDMGRLKSLYSRAFLSVSPGYAGLQVTQSLGFGVPILISRNEPHAPEIEAVSPGFNGQYFETDSAADLSQKILNAWERPRLFANGDEIAAACARAYSVEAMANGIESALESAART